MKKLLLALLLLLLPFQTQGQSRQFVRANSDKIAIPDTASSAWTNPFTLSAWIYLDSLPSVTSVDNVIFGLGAVGTWGLLVDYRLSGVLQWLLITTVTAGVDCVRLYNIDLSTGRWYHFALTVDSSLDDANEAKIYIDGSRVTQTFTQNSWSTTASYLATTRIGVFPSDFGWWDGRIAQMAKFNRVLNQAELTALVRGARFDRIGPPSGYDFAYRLDGQSPEADSGPNHYASTSITGTSRANGPPTVPR